jgi:hypothetical protein
MDKKVIIGFVFVLILCLSISVGVFIFSQSSDETTTYITPPETTTSRPETTTSRPETTTSRPEDKVFIKLKGKSGNENVAFYINDSLVKKVKLSKSDKLYTFENTNIQSVTIEFENDTPSKDVFVDTITLNGNNIKDKFTIPKFSSRSDYRTNFIEKVKKGLYLWSGKYVFTM